MRLFIAVELPETVREQTRRAAAALKEAVVSGRFPGKQNYHITLAFLGEVPMSAVNRIKTAMDCCSAPPFEITVGGLGRFKRREGDVIWTRVSAPETLFSLQRELLLELAKRGFDLENRTFTPHITLARGVEFRNGFTLESFSDHAETSVFTARQMTLMESRLIEGRRIYSPVYTRTFEKLNDG